jgi:hypothetical protein
MDRVAVHDADDRPEQRLGTGWSEVGRQPHEGKGQDEPEPRTAAGLSPDALTPGHQPSAPPASHAATWTARHGVGSQAEATTMECAVPVGYRFTRQPRGNWHISTL